MSDVEFPEYAAEVEGQTAYCDGRPPTDNPYPEGSKNWTSWKESYDWWVEKNGGPNS